MATRVKRVVPDRIDLRDRPYQPAIASAPPPRLNSFADGPVPIRLGPLDQGKTSACTGFSLARVIDFLLIRAGRAAEGPVSAFMLYSMARRYDEFPGFKADEGSSLRGALKGWYRHGACGGGLWTTEPMPKPVADPQDDWWQDAALRPLGAYYRVDSRSVTDMQVALAEVGAIYASAVCHSGWDEGSRAPRRAQEWLIPARRASPMDGGHAFAIVGYDRKGFLVLNSWGPDWGAGGLATLTYEDWLDHAMDCWVAQLGVATEQHREVSKALTLRMQAGRPVELASEPTLRNREISPFVINVEHDGKLSNSGLFRTQPSDIDALVTIHLQTARQRWGLAPHDPIDLAVYAHGGLVSEEAAAKTAAAWIPALYDAQVFPVFLMWETDLWSTLKNRLADVVGDLAGAAAAERPTAGLRDQLQRFWNRRVERSLSAPGSLIWEEMKENAEAIATRAGSGLLRLYKAGVDKGTLSPRNVRVHLIGHSAGAIVLSHAAQALISGGWDISTVSFMAPAVRCDVFDATIAPQLGKQVRRYHQYHLQDSVEQRDDTCRPLLLYGRSLLYLVSESFEHGQGLSILGLEKAFGAYRRRAGIQEHVAPGPDSEASTHGGFDDDRRTREAVIAGLLAARRAAGARKPRTAARRRTPAGRR